jgi:hypothetical protein
MKIPGMFNKASKYHRFEYKPRYFDPKKEEHEAREERIRQELAREKGISPEETEVNPYNYRARMAGTFQEARRRSKPAGEPNVALIRIGVMLLIALLLVGFLTWGAKVVYSLFLIFPIWIYLRFFKPKNEKSS